jgi:uncharacterized protein (TIGR04255 family)
MTFDQEAHRRLRFQRNALKVVVAQVRFPTAYALADPAVQARLQAAVAERFPMPLPPVQEIIVALTAKGPEQVQAQQGPVRFADADKRRIISIAPAMASLETTDYVGWEDFRAELRQLLDLVATHGGPIGFTRFGIRYVDEIAIDGLVTVTDWVRALAPGVLGDPDGLAQDPRALRTEQRVIIPVGDDVVNVLYGFVRDPEPNASPASTYVIDTDIFTETAQPWSPDALIERADRYHRWMTNIFVRSLTIEGIGLLGGTER